MEAKRRRDGSDRSDVDDGRHFPNTADDSTEPAEGWQDVIRRSMTKATHDVLAADHAKPSIYTGSCGAAYALLLLARRGLHVQPREAVAEALRRAEEAESRFDSRRVTLLEGSPGSVALQAMAHVQQGDTPAAVACVSRLGGTAVARAAALNSNECEVLYGRCGFLCAVLQVRESLGDKSILAEKAAELVEQILSAGRRDAHGEWPLYYEWHEKCYFGGAHGIAGILLTLLQLPEELQSAQGGEGLRLVRGTADVLLSRRFRSGNLPSSEGNSKDRCVHWCHGATGLVPLLVKMAEVYNEQRYLMMALETGQIVWRRGLLSTKGLGLCHGTPGNGYALLVCYRATGDRLWLRRAQHFAVFAAEYEAQLLPLADRPFSLFEGVAGAVCFWADTLYASTSTFIRDLCFPCYEFQVSPRESHQS
eukprot:TRINITY_DN27199_c0_g1_i1.p1 TRINITY_DN27199_c0_g1~~TRINITY_DN27199_c0_g1_i1.p1  ORF type:complete len:421 (+),score=59.20 TRINITY_DN27199_c0_g1_i1:147-1409(+)